MVDNLKSCNLQGTAADTDTRTQIQIQMQIRMRMNVAAIMVAVVVAAALLWTFLLSWLRPTQSQKPNNNNALNVCCGHCYAGMQQQLQQRQQQQRQQRRLAGHSSLKAWQAMPRPRATTDPAELRSRR